MIQKVVNKMENEKALAITQVCREFNVTPSDLVCLLQTLSEISEKEAKKLIWMATGIELASNTEVKESNQ